MNGIGVKYDRKVKIIKIEKYRLDVKYLGSTCWE